MLFNGKPPLQSVYAQVVEKQKKKKRKTAKEGWNQKKKEIPVGAAVNPLPALSSPRTGPHTAKVVQEDAHPAVGLMSAPASSTCVCVRSQRQRVWSGSRLLMRLLKMPVDGFLTSSSSSSTINRVDQCTLSSNRAATKTP